MTTKSTLCGPWSSNAFKISLSNLGSFLNLRSKLRVSSDLARLRLSQRRGLSASATCGFIARTAKVAFTPSSKSDAFLSDEFSDALVAETLS